MIIINEEKKIFTLHTKHSTYQCKVGEYGVLLHLYYGERVEAEDLSHLIIQGDWGFSGNPYEAGTDRTFSLDTLPQEFPSSGVGDYRIGPVGLVNGDGSRGVDLRYVGHVVKEGKYKINGMPALYENEPGESETLEITVADLHTGVKAVLSYGVYEKLDIITRNARIINDGKESIVLTRALSASLDLSYGDWELLHFHGRHNMERETERSAVPYGTVRLTSSRGNSSHQHNPSFLLCEKGSNEDYGKCYGISLLYSGNFTADIEKSQTGLVRAVIGQGDQTFCWNLESGEAFDTPEAVFSFSNQGFTQLSHNFHEAYRNHLCRGKYKKMVRPVLVNNWEATYFDFDEDKLLQIAKKAKDLDIEMLVMDDGWFGDRNGDNSSLGDWFVNLKKLPGGLKHLVDQVNQLGLKFGIWVEPEMVSENSLLYEKHPEWAISIPGRKPNRSRFQLVLDMSREEVQDYLFDAVSKVLDEANIEYLKWDVNRSICDWYSHKLPVNRQGELPHRYMLGVYRLLERLTCAYPDVLFEGCSGGGGRFDPGMLYYHPQIWCSDNTDAVDRLRIQYGTSFFYPMSTIGAHVSAIPNHQTKRNISLKSRGVAAMAGCFGYELDITHITDEDKAEMKEQISFYKEIRDTVLFGRYYRLSNPYEGDGLTLWMNVSEDKNAFLLSVLGDRVHANPQPLLIRLKGLAPDKVYQIGEVSFTGAVLMTAGIAYPGLSGDNPTIQLYGQVNE